MKLMDLLGPEVIVEDMEATTSAEAIDELLNRLVQAKRLAPDQLEPAREIVHAREKSMSTGIGHGVAIPHGTLPDLAGVVGALGRSRAGVAFNALDGKPVHLVVLVVVGEAAYRQHIRTLAIVSRLLNSAALRSHLIGAVSADEMLRLIEAEESGAVRAKRTL